MKSTPARHALAIAALLAASGCSNDTTTADAEPAAAAPAVTAASASTPSTPEQPAMPDRYRKNFMRAFAAATDGRSPTMACTSVIAMAAGSPLPDGAMPAPDNIRAFELCYIDVGARYIDTLLGQVIAGGAKDESCAKIASYVVIARTSLGSFAGNIRLDVATLDQRLLERVRARMTTTCPDQIEALSDYR